MKEEIEKAVELLTNLIRAKLCSSIAYINDDQMNFFQDNLKLTLHNQYENHWFPEKPERGSGYRCLRVNHTMDPIILKAGIESGINEETLKKLLPLELTLWVDPYAVSYRIGENGSICTLFQSTPQNGQQDFSNQNPPHVNYLRKTLNTVVYKTHSSSVTISRYTRAYLNAKEN